MQHPLSCKHIGALPHHTGSAHTTIFDDVSAWDSVFFVRVAKCGYETDMINAFFPLLPLVMRLGSAFLCEWWEGNGVCRGVVSVWGFVVGSCESKAQGFHEGAMSPGYSPS